MKVELYMDHSKWVDVTESKWHLDFLRRLDRGEYGGFRLRYSVVRLMDDEGVELTRIPVQYLDAEQIESLMSYLEV